MAKQIWKALDNLSPSDIKLMDLPRQPDGLYNMHFNEYGDVEKRAGYAVYNTTVIGLGSLHKILGMHRYYQQDLTKEFIVAWNRGWYKMSDESGHTITTLLSESGTDFTTTADQDTYWVDFLNHCYGVNSKGLWKYGGTYVRTVGITVPDKPTFSSNIDGSLGTGTYYFKVTYVDEDDYESNGSIASAAMTSSADPNDGIIITVPVSSDKKIEARRIYRTSVDGAIYYYDGELDNNTTGTEFLDASNWTSTNWTGGFVAGWDHTTGNTSVLSHDHAAVNETEYQIIYTITGRTVGSFTIAFGGQSKSSITETGTFILTTTSTAVLTITPTSDFDGAIIISIKTPLVTRFASTQADGDLGTILHTNHTAPPSTSHLIAKRRNKIYLADNDYLYPSYTSDVEYFPPLWRLRTGNSQKIMGLLEQLTALPVTTADSIERLVGTDEDNFEFRNSYSTEGNLAMRSYVNCDNLLVYLGFNGINYFDGVSSGIFSEALNEYIKDNIIDAYRHLSCATYWNNKYILCYPKTGTVPSETVWYDLKNKTYGVYSFAFSCFSIWDKGTDGLKLKGGSNTIGQVYSVFSGLDDKGSAIEAYDQTDYLDFGIPEREKGYYKIYIRCESTDSTTLTVYYQTDIEDEASVTATLASDKDQWYEIDLPGGVSGRAIKIRPQVDDKYDVTFKGYMIQYDVKELIV